MRIISGKYKGRRLNPPANFRARPTTDFARESLFNILSVRYDFSNLLVLDLFAGTGSIGFEFASRGSAHVDMVEINRVHASFIRSSVDTLSADNISVFQVNVKDFLRRQNKAYDLIFADPPYNLKWLEQIPGMIYESGLLKQNAVFILEHPGQYDFSRHEGFSEHRHYGSVNFTFFSSLIDIQ